MRPLKIICVIFYIIAFGSILNAQTKPALLVVENSFKYSEDYRCGKAINQYVFNIIDSIINSDVKKHKLRLAKRVFDVELMIPDSNDRGAEPMVKKTTNLKDIDAVMIIHATHALTYGKYTVMYKNRQYIFPHRIPDLFKLSTGSRRGTYDLFDYGPVWYIRFKYGEYVGNVYDEIKREFPGRYVTDFPWEFNDTIQ